jgi:hypothetical protein
MEFIYQVTLKNKPSQNLQVLIYCIPLICNGKV